MDITAHCERYEDMWLVNVPEIEGLHTQVRRLDQVDAMVRDAAALLTGQDEAAFNITLIPHLARIEADAIEQTKAARDRLMQAETTAAQTSRATVAKLRAQGLTIRDAATLLDITPQRVSQLA